MLAQLLYLLPGKFVRLSAAFRSLNKPTSSVTARVNLVPKARLVSDVHGCGLYGKRRQLLELVPLRFSFAPGQLLAARFPNKPPGISHTIAAARS